MSQIIRLVTALTLVPFLFFPAIPSWASDNNEQVSIVLDASGSMWGQINDQAKIAIAKDVVRDLIKDWDPNIELGLTVYGHRKKGDCEDIETLVPVSALNKPSFESALSSLKPKGKTPLTKAVLQAAEELKFTEQKATVILVSDGIETCDYDPCAVAQELEEKGVDFTTHVVGFDLTEREAEQQLECLAKNTGGKFMLAKDAASLKSSLDAAVKEVAKKKTGVQLVAVNEPGGQPLENMYWQIYAAASPDSKALESGKSTAPRYELEPGKYLAKVKSIKGKATAQHEFEVVQDNMERVEVLIASEGIINLVAVTEPGAKPLERVYWTIEEIISADSMEKPTQVAAGSGSTPQYKLLPGKYLAKVRSLKGKAKAKQEIEVLAGKKTKIEVIMPAEGIIELVAVNQSGGKPLSNVYWEVETKIASDSMDKPEKVAYGSGSQPKYQLLPGSYIAKVRSLKGQAKAQAEVKVAGNKRTRTEVIMPAEGDLQLSLVSDAGGKPLSGIYWEILTLVPGDSIEGPERITYGGGATPRYRLLPGKYLARGSSNKFGKVEKEVEVVAGKLVKEELVLVDEG